MELGVSQTGGVLAGPCLGVSPKRSTALEALEAALAALEESSISEMEGHVECHGLRLCPGTLWDIGRRIKCLNMVVMWWPTFLITDFFWGGRCLQVFQGFPSPLLMLTG